MEKIPQCSDSEESLNIEMTGDPDAWDPDGFPKGGGSEGNKIMVIEDKLKQRLEEYQKFITDLLEEVNKSVFQCLVASWVDKKKLRAMAIKLMRLAKLKEKKRKESKKSTK